MKLFNTGESNFIAKDINGKVVILEPKQTMDVTEEFAKKIEKIPAYKMIKVIKVSEEERLKAEAEEKARIEKEQEEARLKAEAEEKLKAEAEEKARIDKEQEDKKKFHGNMKNRGN